jgi:hypothetical protein
MFLLDYHTRGDAQVGKDATLEETVELLNLSKPDVIQVHAKGNPGWTTYPSKTGFTPPMLKTDMLQLYKEAARETGAHFSAYYNLGRDGQVMARYPEWNRIKANGKLADRALCYQSGVAEQYLIPMISEIMDHYNPQGFWFDGSCFTVENCYCSHCEDRFTKETGLAPPKNAEQPGWAAYKEMQRQIYRELLAKVAKAIKSRNPDCLMAVNLAYGNQMPEDVPAYLDYLTCDIGNEVDKIPFQAAWFDSQGKPFDIMTTNYYSDEDGLKTKPRGQMEQELAIIIANGGKYYAWDNPTPTAKLSRERFEFLGEVVAPFLRARQPYCMNSTRIPDVSLFHGATNNYAFIKNQPHAFLRYNRYVSQANLSLRQLHLTPELISDSKLEKGIIRGKLLVVENPLELSASNIKALKEYISKGGNVLISGNMVFSPGLGQITSLTHKGTYETVAAIPDKEATPTPGLKVPVLVQGKGKVLLKGHTPEGKEVPLLYARRLGKGNLYTYPIPLYSSEEATSEFTQTRKAMQALITGMLLPADERIVAADAPESLEVILRKQEGQTVLHMINMATGTRLNEDKRVWNLKAQIINIPKAPACELVIRLPQEPKSVCLQPANTRLDWKYKNGKLYITAPAFDMHQMIVIR